MTSQSRVWKTKLIVSRESFERTAYWIAEAKSEASERVKFVLIGNKSDLSELRQVGYEEGQLLAEKHGMLFMETSAKQNTNVREMFFKAGLEIMKDVKNGLISIDDAGSEGVKRNKDFK